MGRDFGLTTDKWQYAKHYNENWVYTITSTARRPRLYSEWVGFNVPPDTA